MQKHRGTNQPGVRGILRSLEWRKREVGDHAGESSRAWTKDTLCASPRALNSVLQVVGRYAGACGLGRAQGCSVRRGQRDGMARLQGVGGRGLAEPWSREVVFDKVLGPQSLLFLVLQDPVEYKVPFLEVLGVGALSLGWAGPRMLHSFPALTSCNLPTPPFPAVCISCPLR